MKNLIIYLTLLIAITVSCNQDNIKLSNNYKELERSIDLSVDILYSQKKNDFQRFHYNVSSDTVISHYKQLKDLEIALKKNLDFFETYRLKIESIKNSHQNNIKSCDFIINCFKTYKDSIISYIVQYDSNGRDIPERLSNFIKKWNQNFSYLNSSDSKSLFNLNLSKLKFDLLLMTIEANQIYFTNWVIDFPVFDAPKILIIDNNEINKDEGYKAKILMGITVSQYAKDIRIKELEINGRTHYVNVKVDAKEISEIKLETKEPGKYKYKGYMKFSGLYGDEYFPFERDFLVK